MKQNLILSFTTDPLHHRCADTASLPPHDRLARSASRNFHSFPWVIFVPQIDRVRLFIQPVGQRLRLQDDIDNPAELENLAMAVPSDTLFALAGCRHAGWVSYALIDTNLFVVPDRWLRDIPIRQAARRAQKAATFIRAHLENPIHIRRAVPND